MLMIVDELDPSNPTAVEGGLEAKSSSFLLVFHPTHLKRQLMGR